MTTEFPDCEIHEAKEIMAIGASVTEQNDKGEYVTRGILLVQCPNCKTIWLQ